MIHANRYIVSLVMVIVLVVVVAAVIFGVRWKKSHEDGTTDGEQKLHGTIESLAFTEQKGISEVLVEEGDKVEAGQVLARLKTDTAAINWTEGVLSAVGRGEPPEAYFGDEQGRKIAFTTAIESARNRLMDAIAQIPIDAESTVGDLVKRDRTVLAALEEMVETAEVVHQEFTTDGTVEVTVQMNMNGGFSQLVLPKVIKQFESVKPITDTSENSSGSDTEGVSAMEEGPYTGMIIDVRGLDVSPCMAPRVYDENGQEVFGPAYASREFAVQKGMIGYVSDMNAATQNPRVADRPLKLRGLRTDGAGGTNIIVSNTAAARLRSASENLAFLRQCRVLIVLDVPDASGEG